ncbi:MAG: hypothetical protein JXA33_12400 [Anaerolineae bacterium]|nr:hypothetical protein [Anaerolineae bacterium]
MNEQKTIEVEAVETPSLDGVVNELDRLFESLGKAVVATVQDLSNLMIIRTDAETRNRMDQMVDAGLVENRRDAATMLIKEGLHAKGGVFEKIDRTSAQIAELRQQVRGIVGNGS